MSHRMDIVGIGVSVWDSLMLVDSLPQPGSVVQAERHLEGIGGGITVAMATAARLGSKTALIDSVGDDPAGIRIFQTLSAEGVDTQAIARHAGLTSSAASIWSDRRSAERTIVFSPGSACERLRWTPQIEQLISQAKILHFNGRHGEICLRAIRVAKECGVKISFDGGAYRYRPEILPMLRAADFAILARQFADSHVRSQADCLRRLPAMELAESLMEEFDCEIVAVTDGPAGSDWVARDGASFHRPAVSPELAIDTTGCGDTFHGAFLHGYARGQGIRRAAELAARVASENARRLGGLAFATNP
ncbi:carbohydrate kinase family protein [Stieleria sp. ICT_E10.1]|uniref:carbohydrate kinase family protein n=1 Tax=Stieleria sedimenti TaxID=2976331 RepID=UPI00217FEE7D|nr:carbohydrate kinase family protein [Stieleria sedimenti]MCS7467498.1 carbohydrate kinase family protein [Stieleria sedimenti]